MPGKSAYTPMKLNLPVAMRAIRQAAACPQLVLFSHTLLTAAEGSTLPALTTSYMFGIS